MRCYIYNAKLALANHVFHLVELEDILGSRSFFQLFDPFILKLFTVKKQHSNFSLSETNLHRVDGQLDI